MAMLKKRRTVTHPMQLTSWSLISAFDAKTRGFMSAAARWWWAELKHCLPDGATRLTAWFNRNEVAVELLADAFVVFGSKGRRTLPISPDPTANAAAIRVATAALDPGRHDGFVLRLPLHCFLFREIRVPASLRGDLDTVLVKDMELRTPLRRGEVMIAHDVIEQTGPTILVRQAILKRAIVTDVAQRLGLQAELLVAILAVEGGAIVATLNSQSLNDAPPRASVSLRSVAIAAWLLVPVLLVALAWTNLHSLDAEIARLESKQRSLRGRALIVRDALDRATAEVASSVALRTRKAEQPGIRDLIEELTRLLPDEAWLTELRLTDKEIVIGGYAPAAASLVPQLARSRIFQSVALNAPIVIDAHENRERLSILLKMRTAQPLGDAP